VPAAAPIDAGITPDAPAKPVKPTGKKHPQPTKPAEDLYEDR